MDIEIRKADLSDLDRLMEWRMRVLAEVFFDDGIKDNEVLKKNNRSYYEEHLADGTHTACFAVVKRTGEIVGCGGICYQKEMPSPDNVFGTNGYLMNIYTLPQLRGKGIGRQMVEFLIQEAKKRGTEKIFLESAEVAKDLYHEIGFMDMEGYMKLPKG
ncbi:MAG: GNAT family N-acetyltransferase [Erysipelotrichaceae bacterium]|jgi:ribosomal protein S18 acetylase RimI-like enzyme|nr:GNAT family N-acetyltransferase [Erysipelotrichaceae bacterium]